MKDYNIITWSLLVFMVVSGAARTIAIKIFFQTGLTDSALVTLLVALGSVLSLPMHWLSLCYARPTETEGDVEKGRRGSRTGLTEESSKAVAWTHRIPKWLRPLVPGLCTFARNLFMILAILHIAASVFEMMFGGLQLIGTVCASRLIRKRTVSWQRWAGVAVVVIGLVVIALSSLLFEAPEPIQPLGLTYMLMGVAGAIVKDTMEELFLQETDFPPLLLCGVEGVYGVLFGIPVYVGLAYQMDPANPFTALQFLGTAFGLWFVPVFVLVNLASDLSQICMTGMTSAMTRNLWKNLMGLATFVGVLILCGLTGGRLGHEWNTISSIVLLLGYAVVAGGIVFYYRNAGDEKAEESINEATEAEADSETGDSVPAMLQVDWPCEI